MTNGRDNVGRFASGNAGGPGRPKRAIEQDYLAALRDAVTPNDWAKVVSRALADAQSGHAKARAWLGQILLGEHRPSLLDLAAREVRGATSDDQITEVATSQASDAQWAAQTQAIIASLGRR